MNEPFAYAAVAMDASESTYVTTSREQAEEACREYGWQLVPLYTAVPESWQLVHENERLRDEIARLRLTEEELDAIEHGLEQIELRSDLESRISAKAICGLLDRLGNDECTA